MESTAQELYDLLNDSDECRFIEAKTASDKSRSILETVCAFANEPDPVVATCSLEWHPGIILMFRNT